MEICAECKLPITDNEPSYYERDPFGGDFGKTYHSHCGDPFGVKAKDAEIERLRSELRTARQTIWLIVSTNGGYTLERSEMEDYPGDDVAQMEWSEDPVTKDVTFRAYAS